ncbi:glycosyltransferase family 4 protein [Cerasicoccus arenae]|uniref:Glycosyltransferase WbuB n=1 Tax=Cerasicoccus arenae TaxID=424488 RepID=A0A8J3DIJ1_9BACT|nr:glycosyltransferase family 4 protein [Cerasicoccus arenae]MBK1858654.1 glycosyltransferase family 4 protein [Cerasicoccus arenae]GHC04774.1 glycosyltransferase WbuB [Cerasicoccus arenae]
MKKRLLMISQVYVPDPAAVGQYMAEAAEALAERDWQVRVLTADHGYDDPTQRFPSHEELGGVSIRRLPFSSLGKASMKQRLAGQLLFCAQAFIHAVFTRKLDAVLVTTSPPMGGILGWAISLVRRVPLKYWVMDINPDQALVMGKVTANSPMARLLEWGNKRVLARASDVIVLDRYMEATMRQKLSTSPARFHDIPPWPMEGHLEKIAHAENPFRKEHQLDGKFVVMYSGNHSMVHPLSTIFQAALRMQDREDIVFLFIGGGVGKEELEALMVEHRPSNIRSLSYLPLDQIKYSLSAADVHLVSMGDNMAGIVHPCKYYAALALAKPILLLGPERCHIADVLAARNCGWRVDHGAVDEAERLLRSLADLSPEVLKAKGEAGHRALEEGMGKAYLMDKFSVCIE